MPIKPDATVEVLPVDLQQRVEIIKAMYRGAKILILDEPTSLLGPTQIENLLGILSHLRDQGNSIILVTHKLAEVMEVADQVTVLRRGKVVTSLETRGIRRANSGPRHDRAATGAAPRAERDRRRRGTADLAQNHRLDGDGRPRPGLAVEGLTLQVNSG